MLPVPVVEGVVKTVAAIRDVVQNHLLKAPPQQVFDEPVPPQSNYFRFRLGPNQVAIAVGARTKAKRYRTLVVWFL